MVLTNVANYGINKASALKFGLTETYAFPKKDKK